MKPKIFIGSSVEGLNVAYAIQQNLTHDVEATVWDQGVFELSKTNIESLNLVLDAIDFGIFVFSPDDVTFMKGKKSTSIRDNVLFELGLFIGKLGRDRVFFITPDGTPLHIPTDLVGVTPGKYDPNREDKSLQAATGAACNQIRIQIKKLGLIKPAVDKEEADDSSKPQSTLGNEWFGHFMNNEYELAKEKLEKVISDKSGDHLHDSEAWLAYTNFKINEISGLQELCSLLEKYKGEFEIQQLVTRMLCWEDYSEKAIEITEKTIADNPPNIELNELLSTCYEKNGDLDKAIETLKVNFPEKNPAIAVALSKLYRKNNAVDDATSVLHSAYMNFPSNELLIYTYGRLLQENDRSKEALYLFNTLTTNYPKKYEYWGYLSNSCVALDLYNNAMIYCKKAEEISESNEAWILHNIGNILNNKGLYTEAMLWLNKGLAIETSSQYAHDRLAKAIKNKDDEYQKFQENCHEGRKLIRSFQLIQEQRPNN